MPLLLNQKISDFFDDLLHDLQCRADTRAYIVGIFDHYQKPVSDDIEGSAGERYCQARAKQNFSNFQRLADYLFFTLITAPQYLERHASQDYYHTIARLSYYSCYKLINRQWLCLEEIADRMLELEDQIKQRLTNITTQKDQDSHIFLFD